MAAQVSLPCRAANHNHRSGLIGEDVNLARQQKADRRGLEKFTSSRQIGLLRRPPPSVVKLGGLLLPTCWMRPSLSWQSWIGVIIGIFWTGGSTQDRDGAIVRDAVLRLHPGDQGYRLGYLLSNVGRCLGDDRVVHTDRPRKHQGDKGKGKCKGKGKEKGHAQPKRVALLACVYFHVFLFFLSLPVSYSLFLS